MMGRAQCRRIGFRALSSIVAATVVGLTAPPAFAQPESAVAPAPAEQKPPGAPASELDRNDCAPSSTKTYSVAAGIQIGVLMPVGVGAMLTHPGDGKVRFQIDAIWEPSNYLQSYSIGGAYHPWDKVFFVGARLRLMQLHAPWSRGFRARTDNQPAIGPEIGVRFSVGASPRFLPFASLGVIFFPSETLSLPPMYSLNLGAAVDWVRGRVP